MTTEYVAIFDTTMRDGEQSPGVSMDQAQKVRIAGELDRMGVDVIEAGFPIASRGDFEAVSAVARAVKGSTVAALCRTNAEDIDLGLRALAGAVSPRIHTFISSSEVHMREKLRKSSDEVFDVAVTAVRYARKGCTSVEFSPEDASRSDPDFLCRLIEGVIGAGATVINIPDTVGYAVPEQFGELIYQLRARIPNSDRAVWSVHCHNDLGMAVANTLAAVMRGEVRQIECTVNGIGERAGNTALEEVVMALRTRHSYYQLDTRIDAKRLVPVSRLVSQITGFVIQPNKAIVGANAFSHASGVHQHGVLKCRDTYEIMNACDVGWPSNRIILGKLSGGAGIRDRLKTLGITVDSEEAFEAGFQMFKDLADKKKGVIYDEDLMVIFGSGAISEQSARWKLVGLTQTSGVGVVPFAKIVLADGDEEHSGEGSGDGPVSSVFSAIEAVVKSGAELDQYLVNAITPGSASQGEVAVRLSKEGCIVHGLGTDTDIIVASAKAYLNAVNKLEG
ncbi:MAG: hypothetical protein RLZZ26_429 [Candidatus Parcubacteria bacterium]